MANETVDLARFAAGLKYEDIPPAVIQRAKDAFADSVATIVFGRDLPWSRMIIDYARKMGSGGNSAILGDGPEGVRAPFAALSNGALAHAFELDCTTRPSSGAHPGATIFTASLATAQEHGFSGKELLTAFVAGTEVMVRIARATKHTNEERGFHAPGTTGPFGAAVACGRLFGFDTETMTNALGIAGSLASGLVEFGRSGTGAMVKRLHFGRAAEGGVMAANLAAGGFTGPRTVIEGECGFLRAYCNEWDFAELTKGLGEIWLTSRISMKRYACHGTAQTPVEAIEYFKENDGLKASDVKSITLKAGKKELSRHNIRNPADVMLGQYSIPFCMALAILRNPHDPRTFRDADVNDPEIRALVDRIELVPWGSAPHPTLITTTTTITTNDGRKLEKTMTDFRGTPEYPFDRQEMRGKCLMLTRHLDASAMNRLFDRIENIESERSVDWIAV